MTLKLRWCLGILCPLATLRQWGISVLQSKNHGAWEELERTECALSRWLVSPTRFTRVYSWGCIVHWQRRQRLNTDELLTNTGPESVIISCIIPAQNKWYNGSITNNSFVLLGNISISSPHISGQVTIIEMHRVWLAGEDVWVHECCAGLERPNKSLQRFCQT